jgi:NAD(P)H dehydrogenase (quinone)
MSRLLVIDGHPDTGTLTNELCTTYQAAAAAHLEVTRLNLRDLTFDLVLHRGYAEPQPLEPDLQAAAAAIVAAEHVAWFFPCWWNAPPALVKGFLDRVLTPGFAFRYDGKHALPQKLLTGRSARFVTSMDSPWIWHRLVNRSALHVQFLRSTLAFVGFGPLRSDTFYNSRKLDAKGRDRARDRMRKVGAQDARRLCETSDLRLAVGINDPR